MFRQAIFTGLWRQEVVGEEVGVGDSEFEGFWECVEKVIQVFGQTQRTEA